MPASAQRPTATAPATPWAVPVRSDCDTTSAPAITSATVGSIVHDEATVTGSGPTPTGTVTFTWYNNTTCTGTGVAAGTVTLVNGIAHPSNDETLTASGGSFKAVYNGDSVYNGSTGACEPLTVKKKDSHVETEIHAAGSSTPITTAAVGTTIHDKATVTGSGPTPTGSVTFKWYTTKDCSGSYTTKGTITLDSNGVAHPSSDVTVPSGGGSFKAFYGGDSVYNGDSSDCEPLSTPKKTSYTDTVIHQDGSSTPITSAYIGSVIHDKATVTGSGSTPTGSVTFKWYTTQDCSGSYTTKGTITLDSSGVAHPSNDVTVPAGGGSFKAFYGGDSALQQLGQRLRAADREEEDQLRGHRDPRLRFVHTHHLGHRRHRRSFSGRKKAAFAKCQVA